ncbi:MAG: hypothetical protein QXX30_00015 [Candidatus Aenigmatarchaeota archaeon]
MKAKKLKTFAIPVIEAIWPSEKDYRGENNEQNKYFFTSVKSSEHKRFSIHQSKYLGYYKIIPLNISNVSVSTSKEGGSFNISFSGDYLYFGIRDILPPHLYIALKNQKVGIENLQEQYPFLEKILIGDPEIKEHYITNYATIAEFINELDTVSIYLVNIPEVVSLGGDTQKKVFPIELWLGSNAGRTKEPETKSLISAQAKTLYNYGLSESDVQELKNVLKTNNLSSLLYFWRKFSHNFLVQYRAQASLMLLLEKNPPIKEEISAFSGTKINEDLMLSIGNVLYWKYFDAIVKEIKIKQSNQNAKGKIETCIERYYNSNTYVSKIITFTAFEHIRAVLDNIFPGKITPGLCYERNKSIESSGKFKAILEAILIENLFRVLAPQALASDSREQIQSFIEIINRALKERKIKHEFSIEGYISGIKTLLEHIQDIYQNINISQKEAFIELEKYKIKDQFKLPISGDGIGLVFRGHITSIKKNISITENNAEIDISISGKGFELPLERHEVYADLTSIRFLAHPLKKFFVNISTPVDATEFLLNTFAPKKIKVRKVNKSNKEEIKILLESRGFDVYYDLVNPKYLVEHGNVIAPSYDATYDELIVYTPLHYVSDVLLQRLKSVYNKIALKQRFLANANVNIPDISIINVIKNIISSNSVYRVFVDSIGYLHIIFDPVNIMSTFSLSLNPPITEKNTISLSTASDEGNITTFVEVQPASFGISSPSETGLATLYGRSVAPAIKDVYTTTNYINGNSPQVKQFLIEGAKIIDKKLKNSIRFENLNKDISKRVKTLSSFINKQSSGKILESLRGKTEKKTFSTQDQIVTVKESLQTQEECGEEVKIIQNSNPSIKVVTTTKSIDIPIDLFVPKELSFIFTVSKETLNDFLNNVNLFMEPKTAGNFREEVVNISSLIEDTCQEINSLGRKLLNLGEGSNLCFYENYNLFALAMILGLNSDLLDRFIKNIEIKVSEKLSLQYPYREGNTKISGTQIYFKDFYYYAIPTNIQETVASLSLILENVSPDLFIYGLRTKRYLDAFVAVGDNLKNEKRISAQKAEIIRKLNSYPLETAKATVIGDTYYIGFTTLIVNEKLPPQKNAYINRKLIKDLQDDISYIASDKNIIIGINEIVEDKNFAQVMKNLIAKIPGYSPPIPSSKKMVADYLLSALQKYLGLSGLENPTTSYFVPLWWIYNISDTFISEYIRILARTPYYHLPNTKREIFENYLYKFMIENEEKISLFSKYLKPQNYLVSQGHIEEVSYTWSINNGFTTTVAMNYLRPAVYTYLPLKTGDKLVLGYVVINSALSKYNESGEKNKFLNQEDYRNIIEEFREQKAELYKFYKNTLNFVELKNKANILSLLEDVDYEV